MEVITIDSKAYKAIIEKLDSIEEYIKTTYVDTNLDEAWVDNYEVCTFLKVCDKTLYRLRKNGDLPYSVLSGKIYYTIGDVKRLLESKKIKSDTSIKDLLDNHRKYTTQRKEDKFKKK